MLIEKESDELQFIETPYFIEINTKKTYKMSKQKFHIFWKRYPYLEFDASNRFQKGWGFFVATVLETVL